MKRKPIYNIMHSTSLGFGCQPVKADTKAEARKKFRAKFPKDRILDCFKSESKPLIRAI